MALTLVEASKYSTTVLQAGVIELFVRDDPIFDLLGYIDILGNSLTYNVETTEPTAQWYLVGDTWVEGTGTVTQSTATLKILGGDVDIDHFLMATRSNINDLKAEMIGAKVKAVKHEYMDTFYYGHTTLDAKGFNGLHELIESGTYNTVGVGTDGAPGVLSFLQLEQVIDMMKVNKPQLMIMSKMMRRYTNVYLRGADGISYDDFANKRIQTILGIPVVVSDYVRDTENILNQYIASNANSYGYDNDVVTTDDGTTIFILSFDAKAVQGLQNSPINIEDLGTLETKDADRFRIKWYASLMFQNILTSVKLTGLDPNGTVTA